MNRGVSQGTIFDPLFFICFTADLWHSINYMHHMSFANDLQVYTHFLLKYLNETVESANKDIEGICKWTNDNNLLLSANKTESIIMGSYKTRLT